MIFIIHIFATFFMTGVIWFCQVVHYPLFRNIPLDAFCEYERKNMATGYVVVPAMILEMLTGLWLVYQHFSLSLVTNIILLGIIWLSTAIYQGPLHT